MIKTKATRGQPSAAGLSDSPLLPPVTTRMHADIVVNEKSDVWLLHDKAFTETIKWAEFDMEDNKVFLIMASGRQQELGIVIPDAMRLHLQDASVFYLIHLHQKKVRDCGVVPFVVRNLTVH